MSQSEGLMDKGAGGDGAILHLSKGIVVREWQESDVVSSTRHMNNKNVWDNLRNRIPHPYAEKDAVAWIKFTRDPANHVRTGAWSPEKGSEGPAIPPFYAVVLNGEAVGGVGLAFADDVYFRTAELGYWIGEEHWGKGIMSTIVPPFMDWAWKTFGILLRINSSNADYNMASGRVLEKSGFKYEGTRPDIVYKQGRIAGELMWGALRPK